MRLLHPQTLFTLATSQELDFSKSTVSRKQALSHAWSEVLKYLATRQTHPKMWLNDRKLGIYSKLVYLYGLEAGCNFNKEYLEKYEEVYKAFSLDMIMSTIKVNLESEFDELYLMSDCVSFHLKGLNLGEAVFGREKWRRVVPIESLQEIVRVSQKAIDNSKAKV